MGKNGKFKPWIFRMSIPLVISGVLMFVKIPGMSNGFHLAWAFVTYILWGTLYSTVNIPYGSMASVITNDPNERTMLSTWRSAGANFAWLIVGAASPFIFFVNNQASANRFLMGAVIFAILSLACYMTCYKLSTERIENVQTQEKLNLGKTFKGILKNKALLVLLLAALLLLVATMLQGTVQTYLLKDYFGNTNGLSLITTSQTVLAFAVIPLITPFAKKFGKKEVSGTAMVISGAIYAAMYFMPNMSMTTFIVLSSIAYFAFSFFMTAIWAFVTDCIDYQELITGIREDGTIYSVYSFSRKVGQAVAGGLGGFALSAVGYDAHLKAQTASTLHGIFALNTIVMGIGFGAVGLILILLYPLNKKRTLQLTEDLNEKRKTA
jgi:GPH family glycoside/pentoside/hexuronide:cation symporter